MNTFYKKIFVIIVVMSSSVAIAKNNDTKMKNPEDNIIALQFAPVVPAPFSQDQDDQYLAGLLNKIIKIDEENYNNPRIKKTHSLTEKKTHSLTEMIAHKTNNHVIVSKNKSFGWNDPLAIASALFCNGAAETPNEFISSIERSVEYPGKYKALIQGRGLYSENKNAHSELTDYIKTGPAHVVKYARLEDITTIKDLYDPTKNRLKESEKDVLKKHTPSLQGEVTCNCYFHGCDLNGVIYFDELTLVYLIQTINGNKHKNNTIQRTQPMMATLETVKAQEIVIPKVHIALVESAPIKTNLDQNVSPATSAIVSNQEKELLIAMAKEDDDDIQTDEDSELKDDKE